MSSKYLLLLVLSQANIESCPPAWYDGENGGVRFLIRAAVFDLDGTLLDTLDDLADSANLALTEFGQPERTALEIRSFIGHGVKKLVERMLGDKPELVEPCMVRFKALYQQHMLDKTCPYPGVVSMLTSLRQMGIKIAVVSNKFDGAVVRICEELLPTLVDVAMGEKPDLPKKPAPDSTLAALKRLGVPPCDAIYIGDADTDVETAHNAGLRCIGVTWGFRDKAHLLKAGADEIAESAQELLDLLLR